MAKVSLNFICVYVIFVLVTIGTASEAVHILFENGTSVSKETILQSHDSFTVVCAGDEPLSWITPNSSSESEVDTSILLTETKFGTYQYGMKLEIKDIAYSYVGFYTCQGASGESSSMYLYVQGDELAVNNEAFFQINGEENGEVVFPCRPTSPDVTVEIQRFSSGDMVDTKYDPKTGFKYEIDSLDQFGDYTCSYSRSEETFEQVIYLNIESSTAIVGIPKMKEINEAHNEIGKPLTLLCKIDHNNVNIRWITPTGHFDNNRMYSLTEKTAEGVVSKLVISPTNYLDNGTYTCEVSNHRGSKNNNTLDIKLYRSDEHFLYLAEENGYTCISINASYSEPVKWNILVRSHPHPEVQWYNNRNEKIKSNSGKYVTSFLTKHAYLEIKDISISDYGNYTIEAKNKYETKSLSLLLNITDKPKVTLKLKEFHLINSMSEVQCKVISNPQPNIYWEFKECETCSYKKINGTFEHQHSIRYISTISISSSQTGSVRCTAINQLGKTFEEAVFYVSDVANGFDIFDFEESMNLNTELVQIGVGETLSMTCGVSSINNTDVNWYLDGKVLQNNDVVTIERSSTKYSKRAKLIISKINFENRGNYTCQTKDGKRRKHIKLEVLKPSMPQFSSNEDETIVILSPQPVIIPCNVQGIPKPNIKWLKNSQPFYPSDDRIIIEDGGRYLNFSYTEIKDEASYTCVASNKLGVASKSTNIQVKNKPRTPTYLYFIIAIILVAALVLAVILIIHIRREKKLQRELKLAGLANFEKGETENINPELGIDEQADLLPYNKKWEFPFENLNIGKQLGSGAFGVVMKAEAKNIMGNGEKTTVAVKMVKKNADPMFIKALASELKIMVHLGQHLNVVNLLGACTKNVAKRELMVIVEYCRFGNLQNFLLRHRNSFINQLDPNTGLIDYSIGADILERSYSRTYSVNSNRNNSTPQVKYADLSFSNSSNNTSAPTVSKSMADYRGNESAYDDNRTGVTEMTNISVNSAGYVDKNFSRHNSMQPQWRSNYTGDYKDRGMIISTRDLMSWAFQVTRGMGYLASRKVLHGDLAARNILLAENNIVKICDFGLAKSMYKDENYKKKSDGPLPIKWMAIESIRDKIFSTQSDVWSFGITCWEIFSLGRTPYPGMDADERLFYKLLEGYRMECPEFASREMYKIMKDCWAPRAIERPSFSNLEERIGLLLEESTKQHYIDLNDPYMQMNNRRLQLGESDYLAMMNSPNFENLSSPSYMNAVVGADGYLTPNKIFSPRLENSPVFDFNINNRNTNTPTEACGVELQPMLNTVIESDGETPLQSPSPNSIANPSYHIMPAINENGYLDMSNGDNREDKEERHYVNNGILV